MRAEEWEEGEMLKSIMSRVKGMACGLGAIVMLAAISIMPITADAAPITLPIGLNPGDEYRLAFVTSTTRDATSTDIAVLQRVCHSGGEHSSRTTSARHHLDGHRFYVHG